MAFKNFYKHLRRPHLLALLCLPLLAQSSGYVTVGDIAKVAGARNATVTVKIPVSVKDGYHINSNVPSEEYLIPLKLTWTATGALEDAKVNYPKPMVQHFEFQEAKEKPLSIYSGNFEISVNFKIAANAQAGPGIAVGMLGYQACSNKACYPPKKIEVKIPYSVQ